MIGAAFRWIDNRMRRLRNFSPVLTFLILLTSTVGVPWLLSRHLFKPEHIDWVFGATVVASALSGAAFSFLPWFLNAPKVRRAPASGALNIIRFIVSTKTFENVFAQAVLDMREEYFDALAKGKVWQARLRHVQLYLTLLMITIALAGAKFGKLFVRLWKISGGGS
jgi:hypothetical protein